MSSTLASLGVIRPPLMPALLTSTSNAPTVSVAAATTRHRSHRVARISRGALRRLAGHTGLDDFLHRFQARGVKEERAAARLHVDSARHNPRIKSRTALG